MVDSSKPAQQGYVKAGAQALDVATTIDVGVGRLGPGPGPDAVLVRLGPPCAEHGIHKGIAFHSKLELAEFIGRLADACHRVWP